MILQYVRYIPVFGPILLPTSSLFKFWLQRKKVFKYSVAFLCSVIAGIRFFNCFLKLNLKTNQNALFLWLSLAERIWRPTLVAFKVFHPIKSTEIGKSFFSKSKTINVDPATRATFDSRECSVDFSPSLY